MDSLSATFSWIILSAAAPPHPPVAMAARIGPPATTSCEPRQARKGAAAAVASGAGVWLIGAATLLKPKDERRKVKGQGIVVLSRFRGAV